MVNLFDWHHTRDPDTGHITLASPCQSLRVDFDPTDTQGVWWRVIHHEPYWQARFSWQTPIEAIAAVTQSLPRILGDRRHADRISLTATGRPQTADFSGWTRTRGERSTTYTSADGHCSLTDQPDDQLRWQIRSSLFDGFDTQWTAAFTRAVPSRLVVQFFAHLVADTPVERTYGDLPHLVQRSTNVVITPIRRAAINPHVHHALTRLADHQRHRR
ncbi:DUF317 domain-containing protein [Streptomyces sp. NPDC090994]|uniref:DUF317 domain-containing protein n=1 Tax=Streptomyces sp. NPDC090994 TaxID=3365969 RepID=UPI0037FF5952